MYHIDITQWYKYVRLRNQAHLIAAQRADLLSSIVGFIAIFAAIFAGYEVAQKNITSYWAIILGSFAIIAAVSNAAMKFFGFEKRKQEHHSSASKYASLQYEIERYLMNPGKSISEDFYERISIQLSEADQTSPLISEKINTKAKQQIEYQTLKEIPLFFTYDAQLTEDSTIQNDKFYEIEGPPVRTYICEPLEMCEYQQSNKIAIKNNLTMTRDGKDQQNELSGEGIMDNNIGFIRYGIHNKSNGNTTFGTMVLKFTNRVQAEGYWMTAGVKGADFLVGKIQMNLRQTP